MRSDFDMWDIEENLRKEGHRFIVGIDEAGRGPLAGPVVAAAVVMPVGLTIPGLRDSKKMTPRQREEIYQCIFGCAQAIGIGIVSHRMIDKINILQSTYLAMKRAINRLTAPIDYVIVDGYPIPGLNYPQKGIIHGDAFCFSIAAASVVAKVTRDRIMVRMGDFFPQYGFAVHKGYPTQSHLDALARYGPCPIHRFSFSPVRRCYERRLPMNAGV